MGNVADRALYKCPQHGLFVEETNGVIWKERCCNFIIKSSLVEGVDYPCGILSPLAQVDDPDLTTGPVSGLDAEALAILRESIALIKEERKKEAATGRELIGDRPNYMFGGPANRRNGKPIMHEAVLVDPEQEEFEKAERERMRAAIGEWKDEPAS